MTERELQAQVEDMLRARPRLVWHHCRRPDHCSGPAGLPDVIACGPGGLLAAELKTDAGDLRPGQRRWRWAMLAAGQRWGLYRPGDLDRLEEDLQEIA